MSNYEPVIAVTMGDAAGTGPEIIAGAMAGGELAPYRLLVIGDAAVLREAGRITGHPVSLRTIRGPQEAEFRPGTVEVLDLDNIDLNSLGRGRVDVMAGKAAYEYIRLAAELALRGEVDAVVTSAISKEALNRAGYRYSGHTGLLAELCGVPDTAMMLVSGNLRVVHLTTHVSLTQAVAAVSAGKIVGLIETTDNALRQLGVARRAIAVAGLNPHAGENGLFGREEIDHIAPAVKAAQDRGLKTYGPFPPDSVFLRAAAGEFDAVVAMYHDQGHIAVKMLGIDRGVNVTLGLPIIRTSVDHGTAFDKAGKGTASHRSLVEAVKLADIMCRHRGLT